MARTATETTNRMRVKGPVGNAIRNYLTRHKLTVREFNEQVLKVPSRNVSVYNWLGGRGLPSKAFVPVLAKTLGKPHAFFEVREEGKAPRKTKPVVAAPEASQGNGADAEKAQMLAAIKQAADDAEQALAELPTSAPMPSGVAYSGNTPTRVVHARKPEAIARERARGMPPPTVPSIADALDGSAKNSLTYWSNGDGSATVTMLYCADRASAQKVFQALAELNVDARADSA